MGQHLWLAAIRHTHQVDARHRLKQFASSMGAAADAAVRHVDLARIDPRGRWGPRGLRFASRWTRPQPERPRQRTVRGRSWDRPARQRARLPAATHATIQVALPQAQLDKRDTGDIAARPVETGDEAELNRVAS